MENLPSDRDIFRLIEKIPDGVLIISNNGEVKYCNPAALELFGKDKRDIIGSDFGFPLVNGSKTEISLNLEGSSKTAEMRVVDTELDGEKSYIVSIRDITQRVEMEENLREKTRELEFHSKILRNIRDNIIVTDMNGKILHVNKAVEELLGYGREELLGESIEILGEDAERSIRQKEIVEKVVENGEWKGEVINYTKEGEQVILESHIWFHSGKEEGDRRYLIGISRDVTDRKKAELEKETIRKQLYQAQKMESLGKLAGGVAHDFNNLLTGIIGYANLLISETDPDDPRMQDIEELLKAAEQGSKLTEQLLSFSRREPSERKNLNLNVKLKEMKKMLLRLLGEDIKLNINYDCNLPNIKFDSNQLNQILMNLTVNARDAMPDGGELSIKTHIKYISKNNADKYPELESGEYACITIEDTGEGIKEENLENIFEPFFSSKENGTGLGLSVVHGIIKQHGGHIEVESEYGRGTTFRIFIPASLGKVKKEKKEKDFKKGTGIKGNGQGILFVEDEKLVRDFGARVLSNKGYRVFITENYTEALEIYRNKREDIDLVVSDMVLPGKSGLELADKITEEKDIPVLICSGYTGKKAQYSTVIKRGYKFLQKPYKAEELLEAIKTAFRKI